MHRSNEQRILFGVAVFLILSTLTTLHFLLNKYHVAMAAGSLSGVFAIPTNNIVNTKTTYDIIFESASTGKIKEIDISFPAGFDISASKIVEVSGIGPGSLSASGQILIYTVDSPLRIPSGSILRIEIGNIVNTIIPASNYTVDVTSKTSTILDGPTSSSPFTIKQIGSLHL